MGREGEREGGGEEGGENTYILLLCMQNEAMY